MSLTECTFCTPDAVLLSNDLAYVRYDAYPVSKGHILIIPHRHVASFFDITPDEKVAMFALLEDARQVLHAKHSPDGYNIGVNDGESAGQTVMHVHIHLIPRYRGDMENPRGGVRGVIPDKQKY